MTGEAEHPTAIVGDQSVQYALGPFPSDEAAREHLRRFPDNTGMWTVPLHHPTARPVPVADDAAARRLFNARHAVEAYSLVAYGSAGGNGEPLSVRLSDLITELLALAATSNIEVQHVLDRARRDHSIESEVD